ncbi:MAG: hypothetical protein V5789_00480 [Colwellia sp.]
MKQSIKITNLFVAFFATFLFSTISTAAVPKITLVKTEVIDQTLLIATAHNNLKLSLVSAKINYTELQTNSVLAKQKQAANKNKSVTLSKVSLIEE